MQKFLDKRWISFPIAFELLVWLVYVCLYKYNYFITLVHGPLSSNFPYPQLIVYAISTTLYLIPYYRYIIPVLLNKKRHVWLLVATIVYFAYVTNVSNLLINWLFFQVNTSENLEAFFENQFAVSLRRSSQLLPGWDLNLLLTDFIAVVCIAFVRFAFESEAKRREVEKNNLALQMHMLKTQLQPHFLFNTLNSIYALSLTHSKDTSRFILLLSEMMRYILYECNKEYIPLQEEIVFLENYFEMEQKKYPQATISLHNSITDQNIMIPPLLFLPLVENSFKHGMHRVKDQAMVRAQVSATAREISFVIENEVNTMPNNFFQKKQGGVGLENIRKRLNLYFPATHTFTTTRQDGKYKAALLIRL